ncbi:DUF4913 domain-containing protein [Ancrocorticia populi]|uniref:DUF4913 domain-containing protein n=1 Tax=Ancrocorticia populi TaxID=2175228 RepID=UPI003F98CD25
MSEEIEKLTSKIVQQILLEDIDAAVNEHLSELFGTDSRIFEYVTTSAKKAAEKAVLPPTTPEPQFASVVEFVDNFIRPMYATTASKQDQANWSPRWYTHSEAVARLDALWRCYEEKRRANPNGFLEEFLRVNADYHMRQLMSADGVFAQCRRDDYPSVPLPIDDE